MRILMLISIAGVCFIITLWFKEQQRIAEWYYRANPTESAVVHMVRSVLLHPQNVTVSDPYDGAYVTHVFQIVGQARARLFSEGLKLSIENESGVEIERIAIRSRVTTADPASFVPFVLDVSLPEYYGPATLVFKTNSADEKRVSVVVQ